MKLLLQNQYKTQINFDADTLFLLSHIYSARRFTYNWILIAFVITVELTSLHCSVYVLQVPY
jgi:hypothetical protein